MRADANPGDSPITADNKRRTTCEVDCVDPYRLVDTVGPRHLSGFVEKNRKWVGVLFNVLLSAKKAVDFLRRNKCDSGVALFEFTMSRLELSQLICAVRSPRAANEHQNQRLPLIVGEADRLPIGRGERKVWRSVAHLKSLGFGFKHRGAGSCPISI
jgi:hypothetical protein